MGNKMVSSDACWVCERAFTHNLTSHDHHVIPRAFGGTNGPQVRICTSHHGLLHAVAQVLVANGKVDISDLDKTAAARLMFLATRAALAEMVTSNEPNKRVLTSFYLPASTNDELLKRLARTSPRMSKQTLLELLVKRFLES